MRLAELHSDLKIQERDELNWKKLKVEGLDGDGEKEAKLVHNLNGTFLFSCRVQPPVPRPSWGSGGACEVVHLRTGALGCAQSSCAAL